MMPTGFLNTNFCLPTYVNCKRANRKLQPKNQVSIFWLLPPSPLFRGFKIHSQALNYFFLDAHLDVVIPGRKLYRATAQYGGKF